MKYNMLYIYIYINQLDMTIHLIHVRSFSHIYSYFHFSNKCYILGKSITIFVLIKYAYFIK